MKKYWPIIVFLILFFSVIAYKLITHPTPFYDWDESIYMESGREMVRQGRLISPLWQNTTWLDKPPLIIFIYGLIGQMTFIAAPEITARIFTLLITLITLAFIYALYNKVLRNKYLSTIVTAVTAMTPLFLQRAQTVNLDIFILLGWVGYILFFDNFWWSLFFLFIGVMSKSLLGFYPIALIFIYEIWQLWRKKISTKEFWSIFRKIFIQSLIMVTWYALMLIVFGRAFWIQHIIESHFRRVTSSIEFHFGERIFYITEAIDQMGYFFWLSLIGGIILFLKLLKEKLPGKKTLFIFYLLPWFIFLNVTKTKIFWYFLPAIPEFAFLSIAWVKEINKKFLIIFFGLLTCGLLIYQSFIKTNVLAANYSKPESYYYLSLKAKNECSSLEVLINKTSRNDFKTLDNLGLSITTTKWWGDHPSMVYYFGKKINLYYDPVSFDKTFQKKGCFVIDQQDKNYLSANLKTEQFGEFYLIKK